MAIDIEKLNHIVQDFVSSATDVQGAAIVTSDGLPLTSNLPASVDEERASAMSAAMLALGERVGSELSRGGVARLYVEGNEGLSVLTSCSKDAVFLVLASKSAKQGLLMLDINRALSDIGRVIS